MTARGDWRRVRQEEALWARFEEVRPRVLGALLDAVSIAMRNKAKVKLVSRPRMADFAAWIVAAEPALGWPAGAFLDSYLANRGRANTSVIDAAESNRTWIQDERVS